jgi:plasmid stabilization system protein ParE
VIVFDDGALVDLERILDFQIQRDPETALGHIRAIREAVLILGGHPEIGRLAGRGSALRELVISRGRSGYVALYEYSEPEGVIRVLAIRHQREAGYRGR